MAVFLILSFGVLMIAVALELWSSSRRRAKEEASARRMSDIANETRCYLDEVGTSFKQVTAAIEQLGPAIVKTLGKDNVQALVPNASSTQVLQPNLIVRIPVQLQESGKAVYFPPQFERWPGYIPELLPLVLRDLERRGVVASPSEKIVRRNCITKISIGKYERIPRLFIIASEETFQVVNHGDTEAEHLLFFLGRFPTSLDTDDIFSWIPRIIIERKNQDREVFSASDPSSYSRSRLDFREGFSLLTFPIHLRSHEPLSVKIERQTTGLMKLGHYRDEFLADYPLDDGCSYVIKCDPWSEVLIHPNPFREDFFSRYKVPRQVGKASELRAGFKKPLRTNEGISLRADFYHNG